MQYWSQIYYLLLGQVAVNSDKLSKGFQILNLREGSRFEKSA